MARSLEQTRWLGQQRRRSTERIKREEEARETRDDCNEKAYRGGATFQKTALPSDLWACGINLPDATARPGTCNDWQTWQAVSGASLCWWTKAPPEAKYKTGPSNLGVASARLPK